MGLALHPKKANVAKGRLLLRWKHYYLASTDPLSLRNSSARSHLSLCSNSVGLWQGHVQTHLTVYYMATQVRFSLRLRLLPLHVCLWARFLRSCSQWSPENSSTHLQLKETPAGQEYLSSLEKWKMFALKCRMRHCIDTGGLKCFKFLKKLYSKQLIKPSRV